MAFEAVGDVCREQARAREILPLAAADEDRSDWNKSDTDAAPESDLSFYLKRLFLPLRREGGQLIAATADTSAENIAWLQAAYGPVRVVGVPKGALLAEIQRRFESRLTEDSVFALARETPSLSARQIITPRQCAALCLLLLAIGASLFVWTVDAAWMLVAAMSLVLWLTVLFRTALALIGAGRNQHAPPVSGGRDANLPLYTVVVPLYREAHMIPALSRFLLDLDYPRDRLQIIVALEADDTETVLAAEALSGVAPFEVVRVPQSHPRTKPNSCVALLSAFAAEPLSLGFPGWTACPSGPFVPTAVVGT